MASTPALTGDFSVSSSFSAPSSITTGRLPTSTSSISPSMTSEAFLPICWLERWISRSEMQKTGSASSSPITTFTTLPSFLATTPWMASGIVTHWYFLTPP